MTQKIAFMTVSADSGHAIRGIGFYAKNLLPHLKEMGKKQHLDIEEITAESKTDLSKFDLIHYPYFDIYTHTLPLLKKTKSVVTIHDVIPLEYPNVYKPGLRGRLNFELQKFSLRQVDNIITDSNYSAIQIEKLLSIKNEKISTIYLAAHERFRPISNKSQINAIKKRYKLPEKFVLYVGDINYSKNINMLISACVKLNIPLCLVGKNIAHIEDLNTSHPELNHLEKSKIFLSSKLIYRLGFVPDQDMPALYTAASIYCQPSFSEGFGIPVLEAMSCGTPIVTSTAGSLTEILGSKLSSYQFDPNSPEQLMGLLKKMMNDTKFRIANAQTGLTRSKYFSWTKTANQTIQVYKQLL